MLKQQITNIILEMIVEDRQRFKKGTFLEHRDEYNKAYNQALQDIREKAPELTDTIVNMIADEIEKYADSQTDKTVAMGIIGTISLLKD
jgi:hypothetical protein